VSLETEIFERRRLFASSLDLILIVDREGTVIDISRSAEAILGYRPEEMIGRKGAALLHPGDLERAGEEMRAARPRHTKLRLPLCDTGGREGHTHEAFDGIALCSRLKLRLVAGPPGNDPPCIGFQHVFLRVDLRLDLFAIFVAIEKV
jgi:PAS domain-containing protein